MSHDAQKLSHWLVIQNMDCPFLNSLKLISQFDWINFFFYTDKNNNDARKPPSRHTVAYFLIDSSS